MLVSSDPAGRRVRGSRDLGVAPNAAVVGGFLRQSAPKPVVTQPTIMKTQYYTATSLDGFIATEDDSVDWLFPLGELNETSYPSFIAEVGALAMGSTTYEWVLGHANEVAASTGSPWPYTQPTWVFSESVSCSRRRSRHPYCPRRRSTRSRGDAHAAGSKNIWIAGAVTSRASSTTQDCWTRSSFRSDP